MTGVLDLLDATWPAAAYSHAGGFTIRDGRGGGSRVSAATADGEGYDEAGIDAAVAAERALGQGPLFMIRDGDDRLDRILAARGYGILTPVNLYAGEVAKMADPAPDPMTAFALWPPFEIMRDLWAEGDIGPARLAIMDRVKGPKTAIMGRSRDRVSGVAFVAIHGHQAMLHALHVAPASRRQGSAVNIMRKAAEWAQHHGALQLFLAVTEQNEAANALYASLGMRIVGQYHYRSE
ncbi:MAG TPA: GNAT family N-acetyltransferase [Albidovulum sp.]|uniref:GNAT family N-acetyltransferase n=1 Tax=Albidovulum sp. TaxID=1872424 RepID=UPI002BDA75A5|nr:GNAT family N-acetyltransferase [Albidovulum sp.]